MSVDLGRLASAPVTWGVWERTVDRDDLVPRDELLEAVRDLGYGAIELGPPAYLGAGASGVESALAAFDLELVGAFVLLHLTGEERAFRGDLEELDRTLEIAAAFPRAVVLLADAGSPERAAAAGKPSDLHRTTLRGLALDRAVERLARAAERCRERGVLAALHPEASSYVEAPAEIERYLERVDSLGFCLDTGHAVVGGGDPVGLATDLAGRLCHVHLKDVDEGVLGRMRAGELDVDAAWGAGLFCPFGDGVVDLAAVLALPLVRDGDAWLVLEQDRIAVRRADLDAVREVEARNRETTIALLGAE